MAADFGAKFTLVREGSLMADIAARAKDAKPILRQWGALLKAGSRQRFDEKAPPLSEATQERRRTATTGSITARGGIRQSYAQQLDRKLARSGNDAARGELARLLRGDFGKGTSGNRAVDRLRRRALNAKRGAFTVRTEAGQFLTHAGVATGKPKPAAGRGGKMRGAFRAKVDGLKAVVENAVRFSKVHDEGGSVGNGATLPAWNFMEISEAARVELSRIALDWLLEGKE